jgi:hypothetical protein
MDLLRRIVASPAVRKALVALVLTILAAAGVSLGTGCGAAIPPAVERAQARLECQLAALERVVPREVAVDLANAARAGNSEYVVRQLLGLGLTPADISAAADAFSACSAEPSADAPAIEPA